MKQVSSGASQKRRFIVENSSTNNENNVFNARGNDTHNHIHHIPTHLPTNVYRVLCNVCRREIRNVSLGVHRSCGEDWIYHCHAGCTILLGSGCGLVGTSIAHNTRGRRLESSHRKILCRTCCCC